MTGPTNKIAHYLLSRQPGAVWNGARRSHLLHLAPKMTVTKFYKSTWVAPATLPVPQHYWSSAISAC